MKKGILIILFLAILLFDFPLIVSANNDKEFEGIYNDQLKMSGADKITDSIPKSTKNSFKNIGISGPDWDEISNIKSSEVFSEILDIVKKTSYEPIRSIAVILSITLLCALFNGLKTSFGDKPLSRVLGIVSTLCICGCIIEQEVKCIDNLSSVIKDTSNFMFIYIPVISGLMISSGQVATAGSYNFMMIAAGNIISQIASRILVPILNMILAITMVSSVSSKVNLSGLGDIFNKIVKWVLEFTMAIFVTLLSLQTFVSSATDNVKTKGMRFAINSFVPIVGGALSDAYSTVYGCLKLLRSGVGAFAILASSFIFLPPIIECLIWMISLNICSAIGDIFELKQISKILKGSSKVISTILVILLCVMTILIVSTVIVIVSGGGY